MSDKETETWRTCQHNQVTTHGNGWVCCACGVGLLSLMVPIPLPLIHKALDVLTKDTQ